MRSPSAHPPPAPPLRLLTPAEAEERLYVRQSWADLWRLRVREIGNDTTRAGDRSKDPGERVPTEPTVPPGARR